MPQSPLIFPKADSDRRKSLGIPGWRHDDRARGGTECRIAFGFPDSLERMIRSSAAREGGTDDDQEDDEDCDRQF